MPTLADVINKINSDITDNGNEEITGLVLNSVLLDMVAQINDLTGKLEDLNTDDATSIVNAINSLKQELDDYINSQTGALTGSDDPNEETPIGFDGRVGTIYLKMSTIGAETIPESYWIYTGVSDVGWLNLTAYNTFKMVVVDHYTDLPAQGQTNRIYFVQDENNTYIWNVNIFPNDYVLVGGVIEGEYIDDTTFNDEFSNPVVPNTGNLYLDTVTGKYYRWDGNYFLPIDQDTGGDGIQSIVAGANITVDNTDPQNPIVSSTGGGGGGGDYIPLSGTEVGEPVTDLIELKSNLIGGVVAGFYEGEHPVTGTQGNSVLSFFDTTTSAGQFTILSKSNSGYQGDLSFSSSPSGGNSTIKSTFPDGGGGSDFVDITLNELGIYARQGGLPFMATEPAHIITKKYVEDFYTTITGYDAGATQTLKHVNGVLQWVTD